ncbi:MAG: DUF6323 family protein [Erysipelotrichaceae bacterium]
MGNELINSNQIAAVVSCNQFLRKKQLEISEQQAYEIVEVAKSCQIDYQLFQFDDKSTIKLIKTFSENQSLRQQEFVDTVKQMLELFYYLRSELDFTVDDNSIIEFLDISYRKTAYENYDLLVDQCDELIRYFNQNGSINEYVKTRNPQTVFTD